MPRTAYPIIALLALLAGVFPLAGCGGAEDTSEAAEAVEGEPLQVGDLIYNVAITRFLNRSLVDDAEYLEGLPEAPPGKSYLGVFLRVESENEDDELPSAQNYAVVDASGRVYEPVETDSQYALDLAAIVPPEGELPEADSTASAGPTEGALLLFLVDDDVSEERPLELEVTSTFGEGTVELDI